MVTCSSAPISYNVQKFPQFDRKRKWMWNYIAELFYMNWIKNKIVGLFMLFFKTSEVVKV